MEKDQSLFGWAWALRAKALELEGDDTIPGDHVHVKMTSSEPRVCQSKPNRIAMTPFRGKMR